MITTKIHNQTCSMHLNMYTNNKTHLSSNTFVFIIHYVKQKNNFNYCGENNHVNKMKKNKKLKLDTLLNIPNWILT